MNEKRHSRWFAFYNNKIFSRNGDGKSPVGINSRPLCICSRLAHICIFKIHALNTELLFRPTICWQTVYFMINWINLNWKTAQFYCICNYWLCCFHHWLGFCKLMSCRSIALANITKSTHIVPADALEARLLLVCHSHTAKSSLLDVASKARVFIGTAK
jgi:hypothetical protein